VGRWGRSFVAAATASTLLFACSLSSSLDEFANTPEGDADGGPSISNPAAGTGDGGVRSEDGATGGDAFADASVNANVDATDASDAATAPACPSLHGPTPVKVTLSSGHFCIDSTEVTRAQYKAFLAAGAPPSTNARCSYKTTYQPTVTLTGDNLPVLGVDWCDAHAFCKWSGKRLCGRIGGGAQTTSNAAIAAEWIYACSAGGTKTYPYGSSYNANACTTGTTAPLAVGSVVTCEGGYPGIFDMSGNASEWADACDQGSGAGSADSCAYFNSAYAESYAPDLVCSKMRTVARNATGAIGIRCCGP
jgi:formylglycine-generating enzyme